MFERLDTRNDGEVSANEFNSAMDQLGLMLTESEVRELSRKYDFNRRGRVNYREVLELAGGRGGRRGRRGDDESSRYTKVTSACAKA